MHPPISDTSFSACSSNMGKKNTSRTYSIFHSFVFSLFFFSLSSYSQKTCPNCGSLEIPYPLSTSPNCGDPNYIVHCDLKSGKLFFNALNSSSYVVVAISAVIQRMVVKPSPWLPGKCVTQDMPMSGGLWLNQTLPFKISSSNTIFLLNCSPRLRVSPLNCTASSLCHVYLDSSGHVDERRAVQCANDIDPCCTFVAGGVPSSYKIRLHASGCRAFRSILHLDPEKPANKWEQGLEIMWQPPREPVCATQHDCSGASECTSLDKNGPSRCLCSKGYHWNAVMGTCFRNETRFLSRLKLKVTMVVLSFLSCAALTSAFVIRKFCRADADQAKLAKEREAILKARNGGKSARIFSLKEVKKATNGFSRERILGSGGFGEVYKGELPDGTVVAVKSAKVGSTKSTQQVLNEVGILSQVNHKNLVRILGCCIDAKQPLLISEYIPNGTLYDHLHGKYSSLLEWKTRVRVALQTAEGLAYLHSAAYNPIYHRDVKSTNILLDENFNAKVADFGISRLAHPGISHVSTCAQGTLGYLDPEYYRNYQLSDKSDVYSFGVVLLELLTSQKAVDFSREPDHVNLAICVSQRVNNGELLEIVDQRLLGSEPSSEMVNSIKVFLQLALACLKEVKVDRPYMKNVVQQLECILEIINNTNEISADEINSTVT